MIVEALVEISITGMMLMLGLVSSSGLLPEFPTWLTGTGEGTVNGAFVWLATAIEPAAAWINWPLLIGVSAFVLLYQIGLTALVLLFRGLFIARKAWPF